MPASPFLCVHHHYGHYDHSLATYGCYLAYLAQQHCMQIDTAGTFFCTRRQGLYFVPHFHNMRLPTPSHPTSSQSSSLCTMLSLQWEPEIIAVAVMYLAGRLCKFDIQEWTSKQSSRRWWEQFVQDVPVELLEGTAVAGARV